MGGTRNLDITSKQSVSHMIQTDEGDHSILSLDTFVSQQKITNIDMIKIDVEGLEIEVIKGFMTGLRNKIAKNLIIELSPCSVENAVCVELLNIIKDSGYYIYDIGLQEYGSVLSSIQCINITNYNFIEFVDSVKLQTNILASINSLE
jgi:hypothetical protein